MKVTAQSLSRGAPHALAVLCAVVSVSNGHSAQAGVNVWTSHGPGTAGISVLAIDPRAPTALYTVCTGVGGCAGHVFKTTDSGGSWNATAAGLPENSTVQTLAVDPN